VCQDATVRIAARFNGPDGSGHGGYSCGLFAAAFPEHAVAEVTLRTPPPLETDLVRRADGVYDGDRLVATVAAAPPPERAAAPVPLAAARAAAASYAGFAGHPFPRCYACGPERPPGDGLRIFAGPVGDGRVAAPWTAPADVDDLTVWAALDCPSGWSIIGPGRPYVLGRFTAAVAKVPAPGEECVVVGECIGVDGRKAFTLSSLYGPDGTRLATARATWIAI
jgi:hypothetical protein